MIWLVAPRSIISCAIVDAAACDEVAGAVISDASSGAMVGDAVVGISGPAIIVTGGDDT